LTKIFIGVLMRAMMKTRGQFKVILILSIALVFMLPSLFSYCSCYLDKMAVKSKDSSHSCCKSTEEGTQDPQKCSHLCYNLANKMQANLNNLNQDRLAFSYLLLVKSLEISSSINDELNSLRTFRQKDDLIPVDLFQYNCAYLL
jgi:hypothetical protein